MLILIEVILWFVIILLCIFLIKAVRQIPVQYARRTADGGSAAVEKNIFGHCPHELDVKNSTYSATLRTTLVPSEITIIAPVPRQLEQAILQGLQQRIPNLNPQRVRPYLQMHEFEALLFADVEAFQPRVRVEADERVVATPLDRVQDS